MGIKVLIISLFFGFFSAQKKKDISISVFQETANDSICVSINNTSNDTVKILLDTHGHE